ncbi:MAG: SurA N-terminal domain-containing protein [Akkermansiaceae bacterium]|nr:SurA N-terminal domain-containing protein [Akkermansiaceae bacterium]
MFSSFTKAIIFGVVVVLPAFSQAPPTNFQNEQTRPPQGPQLVNKIAAKVNGDLITLNELMIKVAPSQSVLMSRYPRRGVAFQKQLNDLKSSILDELIDRAIIFTEFKDRVRSFPDYQIEDEVKRVVQNVYKGDEQLFKKYLKATNLTRDQFKEQQRKELLVQIVRAQQFGDVAIPKENELRAEYERWSITNRDRTRDIGTYRRIYLHKNRGSGPFAQLKLAEDIVKKLNNGEDFNDLAKQYSNGSHAEQGGVWKGVPRTDLAMEFGTLLFETNGSKIMGPFEDRIGFNIVQVMERKLGPAKPFEKVREEIQQRVISDKKKSNYQKWMKKMRARAVIKKML